MEEKLKNNAKLRESLQFKNEVQQIEPVRSIGAEVKDLNKLGISIELKAIKKQSKKPTKVACMTHLHPDLNEKIERISEESGMAKSRVIEHLLLKFLEI